jgi:UDP-GlcNAc:undecaprenyl-phosphate GlcNAc-1-phosphate transferase
MRYIAPLISFVLCMVLTPVVRRLAVRRSWIAQPAADRWHQKPTALMGGIAIYAAAALPMAWFGDFFSFWPHLQHRSPEIGLPSIAATAFIGASLLFVLGLVDDFLKLKPHTKLIGQIMVASMVAFLGFRLQWFESLTVDTVVTIFWIVGITNAFNLLDNMDGLCAGTGAIASLILAYLFQGVSIEAQTVSLCLGAALIAFLFFNFNPASIFMGDSGSLVIGFVLSLLTLQYAGIRSDNMFSPYAVPILVMLVPVFDTTLVTFIRILSGRKASTGGRDHTSHRLVLMGLSEKKAVLFLYGVGIVSGLSAVFVSRSDTLGSPAVIIPTALAVILMGIYLAQLRVYPEKEFSVLRDKAYTPILIEVTYKKQLLLVVFDFCLIAFAYYLSYRLRFSGSEFSYYFQVFLRSLPAVIACKFLAFFAMGIYRGIWRYMSVNDVYVYLKASVFGTLLSVVVITFIFRFRDFSKGLFLIDWFLTTGFLLASRGSFRLFIDTMKRRTLSGERVLIYGAGRGGEILLREILNNSGLHLHPAGFIDDDVLKAGKKLHGYPVLGTAGDLENLMDRHRIQGVLVSFRSHSPDRLHQTASICRRKGAFIKQFSICLEDVVVPVFTTAKDGTSSKIN